MRNVEDLACAVRHYKTTVISTSGVEQTWALNAWIFGAGRGHGSEHNELCIIKIVTDYRADERDEVILRARRIWSTIMGKPRDWTDAETRRTKGVALRKSTATDTEKAWIEKRRRA